jgi:diguanylate cyclase (GGDEF)-like protein/PAS domain S-box-containing protein
MSAFEDPDIYRDILDNLQIGVSVLDLQRRIVFWSDGAEQITGYSRMDVLGHASSENILQHCNETSCEMCTDKCPLAIALHDAKPVETMSFIHHKSGHRTQVHTWAIPLRDKRGSIIGIIQTFEGEFAIAGPDPNDRRMKEQGWLDEVTGLPNRAMMQSHLRETLGSFNEHHVPFGVVFLELNNLSEFRSKYGQGAARTILQVLARTLRNTVFATDLVGIWSEERFLVILLGCTEYALQSVSDRMLKMMANATIRWWGEDLSLPLAIGRTGAVGGDSVETLVQRALNELIRNQEARPIRIAAAAGNPS